MKKEVLIGIIVYILVIITGGISLFAEQSESAWMFMMMAFPAFCLPYFWLYDSTTTPRWLLKSVYYASVVFYLIIVLVNDMVLGDFISEEFAILALLLVYATALLVLFLGFISYVIAIKDAWYDDTLKYLVIANAVIAVIYIMINNIIGAYILGPIFILLSSYTLYKLYIKRI